MKTSPQRTCMGCNEKKNKEELIRIVRNKQNEIAIDKTKKAEGRGVYLCNNVVCLEKAIKTKRIERVLKCKIDTGIYEEIRTLIENLQDINL